MSTKLDLVILAIEHLLRALECLQSAESEVVQDSDDTSSLDEMCSALLERIMTWPVRSNGESRSSLRDRFESQLSPNELAIVRELDASLNWSDSERGREITEAVSYLTKLRRRLRNP